MEHLSFQLNKLKDSLKDKFIFLFLDYDGTLTPIVESPDKAIISRKTMEILKGLSKNPHCRVAIISGRALKDIKNKIGLEGIIYAGNHGLEIDGPKIKFKTPVSSGYMMILKKIKAVLKKRARQDSKIQNNFIADFPNTGAEVDDDVFEEEEYEVNLAIEHVLEKRLKQIEEDLSKIEKGMYQI